MCSGFCYSGTLFQESLQVVAQQVRLNFQHIPKVLGAQESSGRLRGVPHTIPDIACPCRGNLLATATIGKSRACAKSRLERGFLARCGLLFGVATGFCEKPFWLSDRISFSTFLYHPLIVLCRCLQFTHAKLNSTRFREPTALAERGSREAMLLKSRLQPFSHLLATDVLIPTICWREMDSNLRWSGYFGFCQTPCPLTNRSKRGSAEDSASYLPRQWQNGPANRQEPGRRSSANYRLDSTSKTRWAGGSRSAPIGPHQNRSYQCRCGPPTSGRPTYKGA